MNQTARNIHPPVVEETAASGSLSLHLIATPAGTPATRTDPADLHPAQQHCLVCTVPLGSPRIRSSRARRLRLKDSLAGNSPARNAGILARDPHFWDYLQQFNLIAYDAEIDSRRSRHFINRVCCVSGRHELDRIAVAGKRFFNLIEKPFLDWLLA